MANLYPTINLPTLIAPRRKSLTQSKKVSPYFDYRTGEFLFAPSGKPKMATPKEAFEQWCVKVCLTERGTRLAYTDKFGVEFNELAGMNDNEAVKSKIIRTITEAIMAHPQTAWVKNFSFKIEADNVYVSFTVKGKDFDESNLTVLV